MCSLEWSGRLKCRATGFDASLSSVSTSRRCSRNRSPSRLHVLPMYSFLPRTSANVIYCITCTLCKKLYTGETGRPKLLSTSSRILQTITQQETVTRLLLILQPIYFHNLFSPHSSSQLIASHCSPAFLNFQLHSEDGLRASYRNSSRQLQSFSGLQSPK